jgi:hypothetical protein
MRLGDPTLSVVDAHVPIDIEKAKCPSMFRDATLRQLAAQQFGTFHRRKACELSAQRFHFRRSVKTDDATQIRRCILLQGFWSLDAYERQ